MLLKQRKRSLLNINHLRSEQALELAALDKICNPPGWSEQIFKDQLQSEHCIALAALEADNMVGYLIASSVVDEGEILNIGVDPNHRRSGVASTLIARMLETFKKQKVTNIYLEVRASNKVAQKFYKKFGFIESGVRKKYYQDNQEDALLMRLFQTA